MNKKRVVVLVIAVVVGVAVALIFFRNPGQKLPSPEKKAQSSAVSDVVRQQADYQKLLQEGKNQEAFTILAELVLEDPENAQLAFEAARVAMLLNKDKLATQYMLQAWQLGKKDLNFFVLLLNRARIPASEKLELFDTRYAELPETGQLLDLKARFYSRNGKNQEALAIWRKLCETSPDEPMILRFSRKLEMLGRRDEALKVLGQQWRKGNLGPRGLNLYISLLVFANRFDDAAALFQDSITVLQNPEIRFKRALFALAVGNLKKSIPLLEVLVDPPEKDQIALAVAHRARMQLALQRSIVDGAGAVLDDLEMLSRKQSASIPQAGVVTPVLGIKVSPRLIDAENLLYAFFRSLQRPGQEDYELLTTLQGLLPDNTVIQYLTLRRDIIQGRPADAVALYGSLSKVHPLALLEGTNGLFYKSPLFLVEVARALKMDLDSGAALALINSLHRRNIYTRDSLEMFQELSAGAGDKEQQWKTQQILMNRFKDDVGIQMQGIILADSLGMRDEALAIIDHLESEAGVSSQNLAMTKLMLMLKDNRVEEVFAQLERRDLPAETKDLIRARAYLQRGDRKKAEQYFVKALDRDNDFYGYLDYARFLLLEGRFAEADKLYQEILADNPQHLAALLGISMIYEEREDFSSAISYLETVVRLREDFGYAYLRLAKLYLMSGRLDSALLYCNRTLALEPDNIPARFLKVLTLVRLADKNRENNTLWRQQMAELERLVAKYRIEAPEDAMMLNAELLVKSELGTTEEQLAIIETIVGLTGWNSDLLRMKLDLLLGLQNNDQVAQLLDREEKLLQPGEVAKYRALILINRGRITEGVQLLQPFTEQNSRLALELLQWLLKNGSEDRIKAVLKDLNLSVNDYIWLGAQALGQGKDNLAQEIYTQGVKKHQDSGLLWNNMAWLGTRLPDYNQQAALDAAAKAFALDKSNPAIVDTYSLILLQQGKYQQCIQLIQEKIPESSRTVVLLDRLARAYEATGDVESALATYDQILMLDDRILLGNNFSRQDIVSRKPRLSEAGGGSSDNE